MRKEFTKENIIANKAASQMLTHISKVPIFIYFFNMDYSTELKVLIPLILAVYLGTNFGKHLLNFLPENIFKLLFKIALLLIALK